ncbi:MAG: histidine--tRNA ligase, partial [Armatimonadetes bacterium]|nr:histidine--tRNA ligase [Armatimonadota bacterium]
MSSFQAVRGTYDLLPGDTSYWHQLESQAHELAQLYGYREIRTPMFEEAELFTRGLGVMAGIVERELWTFHDKFGKKLALRADMTASVVRAYRQHKLGEKKGVSKLYYLAPVFLLGKESQQGSRQAYQFGAEALGSSSPALDAELIALASEFCNRIGLTDHAIELNTLGSEKCRPEYEERLRDFFSGRAGDLCATCKRKFKAHPLWVLGCEEPGCIAMAQLSPTIYGVLDPETRTHFTALKSFLKELEIPVQLNPRVLKDVEYYDSTVFRVTHHDRNLGFGGRYDGLVEELGGRPTPAIGFALSLDAVMECLREQEDALPPPEAPQVVLAPEGPEATRVMVPVLHRLLRLGIRAEMSYENSRLPDEVSVAITLTEADAYRGHAVIDDRDSGKSQRVLASRLGERLLDYLGLEERADSLRTVRKRLTRTRRSSRAEAAEVREKPSVADRKRRREGEPQPVSPALESDSESRSSRRRRRRKKSRTLSHAAEPVHTERASRGDDLRRDDSRRDEYRRDDSRRDEVRREAPGRDDSRRDEVRREAPGRDDSRRDEVRREAPRRDDSHRDEVRREAPRRDDSHRDEV